MNVMSRLFAAAAVAAIFAGCATVTRPAYDTLVARGGEASDAPKNTMAAFRLAIERGFGFVCEVAPSNDGRVVAFQDGTEGSPAPLEDVLELARSGRPIYLRVKGGAEIVPAIKSAMAAQPAATPGNVLFQSFCPACCKALKEAMPDYRVVLLSKLEGVASAGDLVAKAREAGADGVGVRFDADLVNEEFVAAVKGEGLSFNVWTLDELPLVLRAFAVGADTVTTNCAKQMFDEYCALYAPEMQSHSEFEERMPDGAAFPSAQVHGF